MADLVVDPGTPRGGEPLPVLLRGRAALGQRGERRADLVEAQADLLGDADEGHAPEDVAGVAALSPGVNGRRGSAPRTRKYRSAEVATPVRSLSAPIVSSASVVMAPARNSLDLKLA